jgi:hypothetical protein
MESPEKAITWLRSFYGFARFEVLTPAVVGGTVFWNITPCSPMKAKRRLVQSLSHPSSESKYKQRKNPE